MYGLDQVTEKSSSHPAPDERGNSEWGVLVDNTDLAMKVMEQLEYDESLERSYISLATPSSPPSGWSLDNLKSLTNATQAQPITSDINGRLITCPDTCVDGLIWMIEQADEEILLSLQYLDVDWSWGWGDNPLVTALEDAAKMAFEFASSSMEHISIKTFSKLLTHSMKIGTRHLVTMSAQSS